MAVMAYWTLDLFSPMSGLRYGLSIRADTSLSI
jgi:hypothetical protein